MRLCNISRCLTRSSAIFSAETVMLIFSRILRRRATHVAVHTRAVPNQSEVAALQYICPSWSFALASARFSVDRSRADRSILQDGTRSDTCVRYLVRSPRAQTTLVDA